MRVYLYLSTVGHTAKHFKYIRFDVIEYKNKNKSSKKKYKIKI